MINLESYADPEGFDPKKYSDFYDLAFFEKCLSIMPITKDHPLTALRHEEIRHLQGLSNMLHYNSVRLFLDFHRKSRELFITEIFPSHATKPKSNDLFLSTILIRNYTPPQVAEDFLHRFSKHYMMLNPPFFYTHDEDENPSPSYEMRDEANEISRIQYREFMIVNKIHVTAI